MKYCVLVAAIAAPVLQATARPHIPTSPQPALSFFHNALKSSWRAVEATLGWSDLANLGIYPEQFVAADKSVYQWLDSNDDFSKIMRLIKYDDSITDILDGSSHGLTFFAPNNDALPDPRHKKDLRAIQVHHQDALSHLSFHMDTLDDDDDDDDKERKRRLFKTILHQVLLYHLLPYDTTSTRLGLNSTVETALVANDGSFDGQPRRLKIEKTLVPPTITLNMYAKVIQGDIEATNGVIHVIDHPLFPPISILDTAYMLPQWLSTTTSAAQKVSLEDALQYHYVHDKEDKKGDFKGAPDVTLFAPSNDAWKKLPEKLIIYLFSPFGTSALRKLLLFHTVPNYLIFSEWIHDANKKGKDGDIVANGEEFDWEFPFHSGLKGHDLCVHIKKTTPTLPIPGIAYFEFHVEGEKLETTDIVGRNGALHIIPSVLDPRKNHHLDEPKWEDWEDWLPRWGEA
jgi:uncharacterized surface protein with fasciclin (FAS1) repeats